MNYTQLPNRQLLSVTGADTVDFLQGIVSNDVRRAMDGAMVYTAMLSPQGKFLHDFFMLPYEGGIALDVERARAADLLQRLKMYRLRSKVELVLLPESIGVCAAWGEGQLPPAAAGILLFPDPRLPAMGFRAIGVLDNVQPWLQQHGQHVDALAYERHRLEHAIPEGGRDMIVDKTLLLEVGFENLRGVDFGKGCYVGQEVTARSKFRAQLRKSLFAVCISGTLPESGTPVTVEGREIGTLRSTLAGIGLAILQVEEVEKARAAKLPLMAGSVAIEVALPEWMNEAKAS